MTPSSVPTAILVGCLALSACESDPVDIEETDLAPVPEGTWHEELEESQRTPDTMLILGTDYEAQPAPTVEATESLLHEEGTVLLDALVAGGLSEEEAVEMAYIVGAHNSGQPYDRVRIRADQWRNELRNIVDTFKVELEEAERREGVTVDRGELAEAGIVLTFGEEEVVR